MIMSDTLALLIKHLGECLEEKGECAALAESCTGGLIAAEITNHAGCSKWFDCGFVTYSNHAKQKLLGVPKSLIDNFGAVSKEVAIAMALGALSHSQATYSLAVTGIAGPDGGSLQKPLGSVWFAWASQHRDPLAEFQLIPGSRHQVRQNAVILALSGLLRFINF